MAVQTLTTVLSPPFKVTPVEVHATSEAFDTLAVEDRVD